MYTAGRGSSEVMFGLDTPMQTCILYREFYWHMWHTLGEEQIELLVIHTLKCQWPPLQGMACSACPKYTYHITCTQLTATSRT